MPVIIVGDEKNFAALRPRLFRGRVSNKVVHEVTEAMAAANPHADLKALERGTVLMVPDDARVSVQGDLSLDRTSRQALRNVAQAGIEALEQLAATAESSAREAAADGKRLSKLLSTRELAAAGRKDKALANDLQAARDATAAEGADAKKRTAAFHQARAEWTKELDELKKRLS
jgi:hypothetical protein